MHQTMPNKQNANIRQNAYWTKCEHTPIGQNANILLFRQKAKGLMRQSC